MFLGSVRPKSPVGLWRIFLLVTLVTTLLFTGKQYQSVSAQAADGGFNPDVNGDVLAIAVQPDGKIVVGGNFTQISGVTRNYIARLHVNGEVDLDFDPAADDTVHALDIQADGKILVGGEFNNIGGSSRNSIARLNMDGSADSEFTASTNQSVLAVRQQSDGKILVGGNFTAVDSQMRNRIARLNNDGSLDVDFNPNADGHVLSLAIQPDEKILVGGRFAYLGTSPVYFIGRLNIDGSIDTTFTGCTNGWVQTIAIQPDGQVLIGGTFTLAFDSVIGETRNRIARFDEGGSLDLDFNPNSNNPVNTLAVQPDGNILVGGSFTSIGGASRNYIARLHSNGIADADFNPGADGNVYALAVQPDCRVLVGGDFSVIGGATHNRLARLNNVCTGVDWTAQTPDISSLFYGIDWGNDLFVAVGSSGVVQTSPDGITWTARTSGTTNALRGVSWSDSQFVAIGDNGEIRTSTDGIGWTSQTSGTNYRLYSVTFGDNLYVAVGNYGIILRSVDGENWLTSIEAIDINNTLYSVTWDGSQFVAVGMLGKILTSPDGVTWTPRTSGTSSYLRGIIIGDERLVAVGSSDVIITSTDGINWETVRNGGSSNLLGVSHKTGQFVAVGSSGGIRTSPDGKYWTERPSGSLDILTAVSWGDDLFIAVGNVGTILTSPPERNTGYLKVTAIPDAAVDDGAQWRLDGDDTWYESKHVLEVEAGTYQVQFKALTGWSTPGGGVEVTFNPNANGAILAIAVQSDGRILVGGEFTKIGGLTRNHIARLKPDGTLDYGFNPNVDGTVRAIALQSDGKILLGGSFSQVGDISANSIARLSIDGSMDSTFNAWVVGQVESLLPLPGGTILVGGNFVNVSGSSHDHLAWISSTGSVSSTFNPNPNGSVYSILYQPDGKFLVSGSFSTISGISRSRIARFNNNGSLDTGFDPTPVQYCSYIRGLALQGDGKILAGGYFSNWNGTSPLGLYRLDTDGTLDSSFKPRANSTYAIAVQADGKILIGGAFSSVNGESRGRFARLLPDGSLDIDFTPEASSTIIRIVKQGAGNYLVGGYFTDFAGMPRNRIAKLNGDLVVEVSKDQTTSTSGMYKEIFDVAVQADPTVGGEVSGTGVYQINQALTVRAEALPDYHFVYWTDGGELVTDAPSYSFNVTGDRTLVANFVQNPPAAFEKTEPVDGIIDLSVDPKLSWGVSTGAVSYEYCVDTSDNDVCDGSWIGVGTDTSVGLDGLTANITHYWQVRAVNSGGNTEADNGAWWSFIKVGPPTADFSGNPISGALPLDVQFTDESTGGSSGWTWYFGDETYDEPWIQKASNGGWAARDQFASVALPDGSIVLMGGNTTSWSPTGLNDVWRSIDQGENWTQMTASAEWSARYGHTSVALPDGSILLMGGSDSVGYKNDVWRSMDQGATWTQVNASASWLARNSPTSVVLPDESVVLMGGVNGTNKLNDVWRSTDQGETWIQMTASAGWTGRYYTASEVLADGSIVLMGGFDGSHRNDVWCSTDQGASWSQLTADAEWSGRSGHESGILPDGSLIVLGGASGGRRNDVWRSIDQGASWSQLTANAAWTGRNLFTSVVLPDASILVMGGLDDTSTRYNDTWRWETASSYEQNPMHTYTGPGTYSVTMQAYNTLGSDRIRKDAYVTTYELPGVFGKTNPLDGSIDQSLTPTLSWETSSSADSYEYCMGSSSGSCDIVNWTNVGLNTSTELSGLITETTYFWQVKAVNTDGTTEADSGAWWSFTTIPNAPVAFTKSSPIDSAIDQLLTITLSWNDSIGAVSYEYCLGTASGSCDVKTWTDVGAELTVEISGLDYSSTYYWQVQAINPGGTVQADDGIWWSFTTEDEVMYLFLPLTIR